MVVIGMGRPRKTLKLKGDSADVLERLKDKKLEGWQRQRLSAVRLGLEAHHTLPEIAVEVGIGTRSISTWFELFRAGGIEGLLTRHPSGKGRKSWLDAETAGGLVEKLTEGQWRRAEDARVWLEEKLQKPLSLAVTYKYLGKAGARLKVPRPVHEKKDPVAVETFRKTLCHKLHQKQIPLEASVHLWVIDEMRFGLQPVTRRVWTLPGVEVVVPVCPRYQWGYTWGALEIGGGGGAQFLNTDSVCQEFSREFLQQIAASDTGAYHIVIQDGAGFHLPEGHEWLPEKVRVLTLPPYSPELNPVERLWDIVKDRICNRVWSDLPTLESALNKVLVEYSTQSAPVHSLIGKGWIHTEVNTSSRSVLAA
jgi:transposase